MLGRPVAGNLKFKFYDPLKLRLESIPTSTGSPSIFVKLKSRTSQLSGTIILQL
jgi:hypothetical protein